MIRIARRFTFDAAHHLVGLPPDHKCMRPHGHTYVIEVVLRAMALTAQGWVMDYGELGTLVNAELKQGYWDHYDLNERMEQPTAERIAMELFDMLERRLPPIGPARIDRVRVWEGAGDTWAEYTP